VRASGAEPQFINDKDYVGIYRRAVESACSDDTTALLLAFDIDDTLANSSGTGDRHLMPAEVLQLLPAEATTMRITVRTSWRLRHALRDNYEREAAWQLPSG
jgi:hypothetical protein